MTQQTSSTASISSPHAAPQGGEGLTITSLAPGQRAHVRAIRAGGELGRRLRDMGLMPGVELAVLRRAPLGDPIAVTLDGYDLSLRCAEAAQVVVEPA